MKIKSIRKVVLDKPIPVYDLSVDDHHNFVINNSQLVVHNCMYHHGDASCNKAIVNMVQCFKNNLSLFEEVGQFGSLRSPEAGAPRYVGTRLAPSFRLVYKDFELLTPKFEEGTEIEPKYFLPIIPMVLVNGGSGLAVAYSSNILNRNPKDVTNACLALLNGKELKNLTPSLNGYKGTFTPDPTVKNKWNIDGVYEKLNGTLLRVTEIPPSMTFEKWEELLDGLVDKKIIKSYQDDSNNNIDYTLRFSREDMEKYTKNPASLVKLLKLRESSTEYFTTLDENGKLMLFDNSVQIVEYFVSFRLSYYQKRKDTLIKKLEDELLVLDNRARYIKGVLDGDIVINHNSDENILKQMEALDLYKKDGNYNYLTRMPMSSTSKQNWAKIKEEVKLKKEEVKALEISVPRDEYIKDLELLKQKLK